MPAYRNLKWSRLDNAAKIFPSTMEKADTRVFRFSCELTGEVDPRLLQQAVEVASESFPGYLAVMRRGLFWYYLEQTDLRPEIAEEALQPCAPLYQRDRRTLLYRVSYYRRRINLEIYHALSDGTGAMTFLKAIVTRYLLLRYPESLRGEALDWIPAPAFEKSADSFQKYYQRVPHTKAPKRPRAYHLRGEFRENEDLQLIEGIASVKEVLAAAHRYQTTLTVYLTAVLIEAVHEEMYLRDEKHPVVIRVPVNLRKYFPSETAKNFFGMIEVSYHFRQSSGEFTDILKTVDETFKQELCPERLSVRMNQLAQLEHNPLVQIVPLPVKNVVLRQARRLSDREETAVISNIGRVTLPEPLTPYVDSFHIFASTLKTQLCLCSFGDRLQMGFSSAFEGAGLQQRFFRRLASEGVAITVSATDFPLEEVKKPPAPSKKPARKAEKQAANGPSAPSGKEG